MSIVSFKQRGNFNNIERFLKSVKRINFKNLLEQFGREGVTALSNATPQDTGKTAASWRYFIKTDRYGFSLNWTNSNEEFGAPVAILIQYGHATSSGRYVQGIDYINPAIRPIFEKMTETITEEVNRL